MLTENDVVDAVCHHLEKNGYKVVRRCITTQKDEDIVATKTSSGITLQVEAKGETGDRTTSRRYGKPFTGAQCRDHVANAFFAAGAALRGTGTSDRRLAGMAFPDTRLHRVHVEKIKDAIDKLRLGVFWVGANREVRLESTWQL